MSKRRSRAPMDAPVLLAQPVMHNVITIVAALMLLGGATFLVFGSYSRRESVRGEVAPSGRSTTVVSEYPGMVSELTIKLGDRVQAGQILATIRVPRVVAEGGDRATVGIERLRQMKINLDLQEREIRTAISDAKASLQDLSQADGRSNLSLLASQEAMLQQRQLATQRLAGIEQLKARGFASQSTLGEAQAVVLQLDQSIADSALTKSELDRSRAERMLSISSQLRASQQSLLELENQKLQLEAQIHDFEAQEFVKIVATNSGVVSSIGIKPGQRIEAGQKLLNVADPTAPLVVVLRVPGSAIGFLERAQKVVLKYDAFPYQSFGLFYGQVASVPSSPAPDEADAAEDDPKTGKKYLVEVRPDDQQIAGYGAKRPLKVGMGLTAEVMLERRTLLSWLLEPLYGFKGSFS